MAIDVYLQLEGIKGESVDSEHVGWIEVDSAIGASRSPKAQPHLRRVAIQPNAVNTALSPLAS
jgi:type VI protein secretion system component Hcp